MLTQGGFAGDGKYFYAVYPDYQTGYEALAVMLKGSKYFHLTLREASLRYVKNDFSHIQKIVKISKLDSNRTIRALSDKEFKIYCKAFERIEKWEIGREDFIEKWYISKVRKQKGIITEYLIDMLNKRVWVSKKNALQLALDGRLHVTIVNLSNGKKYLRPEYNLKAFSYVVERHHA